jgi:nitrite reductase/ring-hydroxylating ferredoxin subunit
VRPGAIKAVRTRGGREIAIASAGGQYFAFQAYCLHQQWPLKWGALEGQTLICGLHGWQFDLASGAVIDPPTDGCLRVYPVRVEGETLYVDVGPS